MEAIEDKMTQLEKARDPKLTRFFHSKFLLKFLNRRYCSKKLSLCDHLLYHVRDEPVLYKQKEPSVGPSFKIILFLLA